MPASGISLAFATNGQAEKPLTRIRAATPGDVPFLMDLKWQMAVEERREDVVRASEVDWRRDAFGPQPRFSAFVAERQAMVVAMVTFNERYYAGWPGPTFVVQDLFVERAHRCSGIGRALLSKVAAHACELNSPLIELVVHEDSPARGFYDKIGLQPVRQCLTYVLAGSPLRELSGRQSTEARDLVDGARSFDPLDRDLVE
jgi:GNAT superfamily N-acetyltransferase